MSRLVARLEQLDPDLNMGAGVNVAPLRLEIAHTARLALLILLAVVTFVLLIACSNVTNLMVARAATREREMAIRTALGARRIRLVRQLLVESVTLSLTAGVLGLALAAGVVRILVVRAPENFVRLNQASIDSSVLAFTLGVSMLSGILFGVLPAWRASGGSCNDALKASGRNSQGFSGRNRTRSLLVVIECAFSIVLLTGTGLLLRSLVAIESVDPGFRPQHLLTIRLDFQPNTPDERKTAFYKELSDQIQALPGVQHVGGISRFFEMGAGFAVALRAVEGRHSEAVNHASSVLWSTITGDYFQTMGVPLLKGRFFSPRDVPTSPLVAIIDQSMARQYWPNQDPLGQRFKGQDRRGIDDEWLTVVGIVGDMRRRGLENQPGPHVFEWEDQAGPFDPDLVVRTASEPASLAAGIRRAVHSIEPAAVIVNLTTIQQQLAEQTAPRRFQISLLAVFALVALILSGTGIYGVMHYSVANRKHEIGVRMALGASAQNVLRMLMREGLTLGLIGVAAGLVMSWWLTGLLKSMLYAVAPGDPITLSGVAALMMTAALIASAVPAWDAARLDPLASLREE